MSKDYYAALGIEKSASQDEVKRAFRKLAHKYHPDKPDGDEAKFKEINEAYQVLSDTQKRQQYDRFGSDAFEGFQGGQGFGGFDFSGFSGGAGNIDDLGDILGSMFGMGGRAGRSRRPRGSDIQVDLDLSFEESVFGVTKEITLTKPNTCERCGGVGAEPGTGTRTCEDCNGQGVKTTRKRTILGTVQARVTCGSCHGSGEVPKEKCTSCSGTGIEKTKKTLTVDVPSGVQEGTLVRVRGEGEAIQAGESGDLILRIFVKADKRFSREGQNIRSELKIGFTQAALGDTVEHETLDGKIALKIPAGIQSNAELRLKGKGVPSSHGRGDHLVTVRVVTPKKLSRQQKKMLAELDLRE